MRATHTNISRYFSVSTWKDKHGTGHGISVEITGALFRDNQPRTHSGFILQKDFTEDAWVNLWNELHKKALHTAVSDGDLSRVNIDGSLNYLASGSRRFGT